jgi:hypothetical protein
MPDTSIKANPGRPGGAKPRAYYSLSGRKGRRATEGVIPPVMELLLDRPDCLASFLKEEVAIAAEGSVEVTSALFGSSAPCATHDAEPHGRGQAELLGSRGRSKSRAQGAFGPPGQNHD